MRASASVLPITVLVASCLGSPARNSSVPTEPSRPEPTNTPSATPGATLTAPPEPGGAWARLGEFPGWLIDGDSWVTGFAGGYVALGLGEENKATAWMSPDGVNWTPNELPSPEPMRNPYLSPDPGKGVHHAYPTALASDGTTVVIVGGYPHEPCGWVNPAEPQGGGGPECITSPISWVSDDGMTWRSSLPWVGLAERAAESTDPWGGFRQGSEFSAVWAVPDGWEAALGYWSGEVAVHREVWHSSDGLTWELRATVFDAAGLDDYPILVGDDGHRILTTTIGHCIASPDCSTSVHAWSSQDGIGWQDVALQDEVSYVSGGIGPSRDGEPWLLAGGRCSRSTDQVVACARGVWASNDLRTWHAVLGLADIALVLGKASDRYVASGWTSDGSAYAWTSSDGTVWVPLPNAPAITALAIGPAGSIGFGIQSSGEPTPVYVFR